MNLTNIKGGSKKTDDTFERIALVLQRWIPPELCLISGEKKRVPLCQDTLWNMFEKIGTHSGATIKYRHVLRVLTLTISINSSTQ